MQTYYYDDDGYYDHWKSREFASMAEALIWGEGINKFYNAEHAILYIEDDEGIMIAIKEWHN